MACTRKKIILIKNSLNLGLSDELKINFPDIAKEEINKVKIKDQNIYNPYWLTGFTSGEGCFHIKIKKSAEVNSGFKISLLFKISQHEKDEKLLSNIKTYLNCGNTYKNRNCIDYTVEKYSDLILKIIPFLSLRAINIKY